MIRVWSISFELPSKLTFEMTRINRLNRCDKFGWINKSGGINQPKYLFEWKKWTF